MMWSQGGERWRMHDGDGAEWLMVVLMLVIAIAVVVAVIALLRGAAPLAAGPRPPAAPRGPDPRAILQERFARGEIDEQEFRSRMRALDDTGHPGG
jgi:putative membrane protein